MRGDESRRFFVCFDKPDGPDLQARAIGRIEWAVDGVADSALFLAHLHDLVRLHMLSQLAGHMLPRFGGKTELVEEARLAASGGVRGVE